MAKDESFESGVASVFDAIASDRKSEAGSKPSAAPTPKRVKDANKPTASKPEPPRHKPQQRPTARTGRFPGSKNGPPKEKITTRIPQELKDAYVDWALDDRCPLSDLMERALTEFYQRHRASSGKSS